MARHLGWFRLLPLLAATFVFCIAEAMAANVFVSPAATSASVGDTININVGISEVSDLSGFQFNIVYDSSILEYVSMSQASFLTHSGTVETFCVTPVTAAGSISSVGCASLSISATGEGLLYSFSFRAASSGVAQIQLSNVQLSNSQAAMISTGITNGQVTVSSAAPTALCGNNIIEATEECDGPDLAGRTCTDFEGFTSGNLHCTANCRFDTSGCAISQALPTCADSDGGQTYYTKGSAIARDSQGTIIANLIDECGDASVLFERYCTADGYASSSAYYCAHGCLDGACIAGCIAEAESLGNQGDASVQCCQGLQQITASSYSEGACTTLANSRGYCSRCGNGVCTYPENSCNCQADCAHQNCTDSDSGIDYYLRGSMKFYGRYECQGGCTFTDYCTENTLNEYYCQDGSLRAMASTSCPNGCVEGACIRQEVTVSAPEQSAIVGNVITVPLRIANVNDLRGFQMVITYNSAVLNLINMSEGTFLNQNGQVQNSCTTPIITEGRITNIACSSLGGAATGSGNLGILTFRALSQGDSGIGISEVRLWDSHDSQIPTTIINGHITVTSPTAVCGNNIVENSEACDGSNFNGKTCQDYQIYVGGTLHCNADCQFDTSDCQAYCTDSDGGKNYNARGTVTLGSASQTDSCTYCTGACEPGSDCAPVSCGGVVEYYCDGNSIQSETWQCRCEEGACVQVTGASISAAERSASVGGIVTVPITISNVNGLFGYQMDINYNSEILEYINTSIGTFLTQNGEVQTFCITPTTTAGAIKNIACTSLSATASGSGTLQNLVFKAKASGTTSIELSNIKLLNAQAVQITATAANGRVTVEGVTTPNCQDTDGGKNYYTKGRVTYNNQDYWDECVGQVLKERYCDTQVATEDKTCTSGCLEGACKQAVSGKAVVIIGSGTAKVGAAVSIPIQIYNVTGLYGWQIDVAYDSSALDLHEMVEGPFLHEGDLQTSCSDPTVSGGKISSIACTILGSSEGASGAGTLATLKFDATQVGTFQVGASVKLFDSLRNVIQGSVKYGTVSVVGLTNTDKENKKSKLQNLLEKLKEWSKELGGTRQKWFNREPTEIAQTKCGVADTNRNGFVSLTEIRTLYAKWVNKKGVSDQEMEKTIKEWLEQKC